MKRTAIVAAALSLAAFAQPAAAQSDILIRARSGNPLGDRMRVDSAGGIVAQGTLGIGLMPATGPGYRFMWMPYFAALRAGSTDDGGAGTYWDFVNVGFFSWTGGNRTIGKGYASMTMGEDMTVTGNYSTGFGSDSEVAGQYGFVAGDNNRCMASYCHAVGYNNNASGTAGIALGYSTTADGNYSTAIGYRASTGGRAGAVVISAGNPSLTTDSVRAQFDNEFVVRAPGGFRFRSSAVNNNGCVIPAGGTAMTCSSSRALKENFTPVDGEDVLRRLRAVPVNTWNVIDEPSRALHMGPFAEDFRAAFGLGETDRGIGLQDIDGVNMAAIQALEARTTAQAAENAALRNDVSRLQAENAALRSDVAQVRSENARLEARLRAIEAALAAPKP